MAKKEPPQGKMTPKEAKKLAETKAVNRAEREIHRSEGHDSRISRDGGTGRRLKR